jgi:hypothetical protein
MIKKTAFAAAAAGLLLAAGQASAVTITFDDGAVTVGDTLSTQYAGVTFSPNAFSGAGGPTGDWADNTGMTIVSSTGTDVGGLGSPSLVSGNLLRSFNGWLGENGDASFLITFTSPVSFVSVDFAGIYDIANNPDPLVAGVAATSLIAYDGATMLGQIYATTQGQVTLSFSAGSITSVAVTPGDYNDWVGVDNITYTAAAVPEVSTYAMMALGVGLLAFKRRKAA